jgi:transcriptional regulator with XRE-family HTH domain
MRKTTSLDKEIGQKIKLHRWTKKKSRNFLGKEIGKSYQQVQNYEYGKHRVAASVLFKIAKILKVKIEEFFPSGSLKD